jgi:hypothetical protein
MLLRYPASYRVKGVPAFMLLLTVGTTLSSAIALVYSLFSRLSASLHDYSGVGRERKGSFSKGDGSTNPLLTRSLQDPDPESSTFRQQLSLLMNVVFVVVDTPLDVRFVFWLSTRPAFTRHYYAALTVLVTTFLGNSVCLWYFLRREIRGSQRFGMWLLKSRSQIAAVLFLALFKFDCLLLICSKLRGWRSLSAPLSERSVHLIMLLGLAGTLLEGIPQLAIFAAVATSKHHHLDFLTSVNLVVCSANIVYQLLNRLLAHLLVDSAGLVVERIHHRGQDNASVNAKSAEQSCSQAVQSYQISPGYSSDR